MIPIQASRTTRQQYVNNIINVFAEATDRQLVAGRDWYPEAHRIANMIADGDTVVGAGLLAALSPQTSWWLNVELAADAFQAGNATRHTGDSTSKANRIMAGEDPVTVLPMRRKTGHFYRCILDPSDDVSVCVDRHAHDIAVGVAYGDQPRGLSAHGRYALIADCYWEASQWLGWTPMEIQAVTWVAWRELLAGTSTRGGVRV